MSVTAPKNTLDFDAAFRLHYKFLCNVSNKILNDREAARDVVQEVFAKLWTKKETLAEMQSVKNYLFRVTVNTTLDYLEKNKSTISLELVKPDVFSSNETEESFGVKELQSKITEALDQLPPRCKVVFVLSRYENMKYREIAEHLGISIKTVENQMGKALELMRKRLKPYLGKEYLALAVSLGLGMLAHLFSLLLLFSFLNY